MERWTVSIMFFVFCTCATVSSQMLDGCPMYGCQPTGTFSMNVPVPRANATVDWVHDHFLGPIPEAMGCVGNTAALVCQSNGPGPADTGYMGISIATGSVTWRDPVLRFPSLPVMDAAGNIWGSDGSNLMRYDVTGKPLSSNVPLNPSMHPLFSLQLLDTADNGPAMLLFVSKNGHIATTLTDGTPVASTVLRGTVERSNGTFLPIAAPVVNKNRFYVLTQFRPDDYKSSNLGLQRLYAIDTSASMADRMTVAWYANFEREKRSQTHPRHSRHRTRSINNSDSDLKPSLLLDEAISTLYVSLPPPASSQENAESGVTFRAIMDSGNYSAQIYQTELNVQNMVLFDGAASTSTKAEEPFAGRQLWVSTTDQRLIALKHDGSISKELDLKGLLKADFTISSRITVTRLKQYEEDYLLFGVTLQSRSEAFAGVAEQLGMDKHQAGQNNFVVCLDTPENIHKESRISSRGMPLAWLVPTPKDTVVNGQIIAIAADEAGAKNRIVAFSQIEGEFGQLFSIV